MDRYVLDDERKSVRIADPNDAAMIGARQKKAELWRVANETVAPGVDVSTVFLGLDHQFYDGPPLLFETMVFANGYAFDNECERFSTWVEAEAGHVAMVAWVKAHLVEHVTPDGDRTEEEGG